MMDVKTYTFYAPCPVLDIEAMQTWLEDMAMDGYLLKDCSKTRHKFHFYKIEPLRTRYRLTPVSDKIEEWNLRPNEEFASITDAFGWEHVCSNYRLHIFRAYDENVREIHTDASVQAQAIRQLGWRIIKTALTWLVIPLVYFFIIYVFGGANYFWQSVLINSSGSQIIMVYFAMFAMVKSIIELVRLYPLYKRLKHGYAPVNRKEWRKKASVHRAAFRAYPVIMIVLAILVVMGRSAYRYSVDFKDLPVVGTGLPFLSVADMAQDSDVLSAERMEDVNYMRNWSHVLSPINYDWAEIVEIVDKDGTEGLVSIHVFYHEPRFDWLAESLTQEYINRAKQLGTEMPEICQTNADIAYFYFNEYGIPSAVLKYGNRVICVEFPRMDIDLKTLKFKTWIEALESGFSEN